MSFSDFKFIHVMSLQNNQQGTKEEMTREHDEEAKTENGTIHTYTQGHLNEEDAGYTQGHLKEEGAGYTQGPLKGEDAGYTQGPLKEEDAGYTQGHLKGEDAGPLVEKDVAMETVEEPATEEHVSEASDLLYRVTDNPPMHLTILFAFQVCFGGHKVTVFRVRGHLDFFGKECILGEG